MSAPQPGQPRPWVEELLAPMWAALDPEWAVRAALERDGDRVRAAGRTWPLLRDDDEPLPVQVIAIGKAAEGMVRGAASALGGHPLAGIIVSPTAGHDLCGLTRLVGEHPVPGEGSHVAAQAVLQELDRPRRPGEWVLFLISGGGSALAESPIAPLTIDDLADVHRRLVGCGADITDINAVRKHLSAVKGGRLAVAAAPARCLTLFVSDVPDGRVDAIASGPTLPIGPEDADRARALLHAPRLADRWPERVQQFAQRLPAPPPPDHEAFARGRHAVVMDNALARTTIVTALAARGVRAVEDVGCDDAPVGEAIEHLLARLDAEARVDAHAPVAVVSGGELSCPVTGDGVGGRNLHFALAAAEQIAGRPTPTLVASVGTDGVDGNAPSAGAAVDGGTWSAARGAGWDPSAELARSNSFAVLDPLGAAIRVGPTGTNVRDVRILVRWPSG